MTMDVRQTVERAEHFDMKLVLERYETDTRLPAAVVQEHEREIKRFLALCALRPGHYGMRGPLDELWHTFIIFTASYQKFCEEVAGQFIHHYPAIQTDATHKQLDSAESYNNFFADYTQVLGQEPPSHIWPKALVGVDSPSCNNCGVACYQKCIA